MNRLALGMFAKHTDTIEIHMQINRKLYVTNDVLHHVIKPL